MDRVDITETNRTADELCLARRHFLQHEQETRDVQELAMLLYSSWYARPQAPVQIPDTFPVDLVQVLKAADVMGRRWSDGWKAEQVSPDGRVIARRGTEIKMADVSSYIAPASPGVRPHAGDQLWLADRRDRVDSGGAWWKTGGASWRFTRAAEGLVRIYWNVALAYLPVLVHRITELLAEDGPSWMLKCAANSEVHARPDATVLYLACDSVDDLAHEIDRIAFDLAPYVCPGAPPLSLSIHPGVAVAVDPGPEESFGEHRCRLIVEGLLEAGAGDEAAALSAISDRLAREGIDCIRPHAHRMDPELPWEK
jgi:hypothetical protein